MEGEEGGNRKGQTLLEVGRTEKDLTLCLAWLQYTQINL
jgi:hypothetical protein